MKWNELSKFLLESKSFLFSIIIISYLKGIREEKFLPLAVLRVPLCVTEKKTSLSVFLKLIGMVVEVIWEESIHGILNGHMGIGESQVLAVTTSSKISTVCLSFVAIGSANWSSVLQNVEQGFMANCLANRQVTERQWTQSWVFMANIIISFPIFYYNTY